jgi:hypothetical protein
MPRKLVVLSESTQCRLRMYTIAAKAAGVGLLALSQAAEAKVIYTPAHRIIGVNSRYRVDLNHDGITDFTFSNIVRCRTFCTYYEVLQRPAGDNGAAGYVFDDRLAVLESALKPGAKIGPRADFFERHVGILIEVKYDPGNTQVYGPWANIGARYLGLKFDIKGKTHYGWARFNVTVHGTKITATLTGYAFETIPGKPIIAGKTAGQAEITLPVDARPGTLGKLALGRL